MPSHTRAHHSSHNLCWESASVTIAVLVALLLLLFLFVFLTLTATPAQGQNRVPPTAAQAAKMPQFASKLAHPMRMGRADNASRLGAQQRASYRTPTDPRTWYGHGGPLDSVDIYDNGPTNGTVDAWTINSGFIVSDSFNVQQNIANGMNFVAWLFPGDVVQSVEISVTSSEFGGTTYFDGVVTLTANNCTTNQLGFTLCVESGIFPDVALNAGTYWVNLQNAVVNTGDPVYWDENSGPSMASQNSIGTIPSESFTILGGTTTTTSTYEAPCPEPQASFRDLRDFDPGTVPSALAVGAGGKLYGALANAGNYGAGLLYDLAQTAASWFLRSLYSFRGGSNGSSPGAFIIGPGGAIYGAAAGGIQNCGPSGNDDCGLIYKAAPAPTVCTTALCGWNETPIYQFTGNSDASDGTVTTFDSQGNLYGVSFSGEGVGGYGAVFELSPTRGGWTETILHAFTGGAGGRNPTSLLMGQDGNLYGTAGGGVPYGEGMVFQLVPSGGHWTENILYSFTGGSSDGALLGSLIQDGSGNFYGTAICASWGLGSCDDDGNYTEGVIWHLSRTAEGWTLNQIHVYENGECYVSNGGEYQSLAFGPAGHLYATEGAGITNFCSGVLDVSSGQVVVYGPPGFGNITSDEKGHLYGTMSTCGFGTLQRNDAMVWQYSP